MAEATEYAFELREVTEALIAHQGITTGKWMLSFEMGLAGGISGPTESDSRPSAIVQIRSLKLAAAKDEAVLKLGHLIVDAAEVAQRQPK